MAIGMGIVFAFLLLLVAILRVMSAAVLRFHPEVHAGPAQGAGPRPAPGAHHAGPDQQIVAVITAAVARYRNDRRQG